MIARMTSGVSPLALTQAHADWAQHLLLSPDEQIELLHKAARKWARFFPPLPQDKRFAGQAWQHWPGHDWTVSGLVASWPATDIKKIFIIGVAAIPF
jgi:hypothetical protein